MSGSDSESSDEANSEAENRRAKAAKKATDDKPKDANALAQAPKGGKKAPIAAKDPEGSSSDSESSA